MIRPLALAVVGRVGPVHGYDVAAKLEGLGVGTVPGGTLYPILRRLEEEGFLRSEWTAGEGGPGRKMYTLTPSGAEEVRNFDADWSRLVVAIEEFNRIEKSNKIEKSHKIEKSNKGET